MSTIFCPKKGKGFNRGSPFRELYTPKDNFDTKVEEIHKRYDMIEKYMIAGFVTFFVIVALPLFFLALQH